MAAVSIIMPAYNVGQYIGAAIASVLGQSFTDWELLIVDDGSIDDTAAIVQRFQDVRIRYFYQPNAGVSAARNRGLEEMQGAFFCFLDADDLFLKDSLSSRLSIFEANRNVAFVDGVVEVRNEQLEQVIRVHRPSFSGFPFSQLIRMSRQCFVGPTWMVRRKEGYRYQLQEGLTHGEDRIFYMQISDHGTYAYTNEMISIYRRRERSAMSDLDGLQRGYEHLYRVVNNKRKRVKLSDRLYLKYKITRIMFLSNLRAGRYHKAFASVLRNAALT